MSPASLSIAAGKLNDQLCGSKVFTIAIDSTSGSLNRGGLFCFRIITLKSAFAGWTEG